MRTITCTTRGESGDFWPEYDEQGNVKLDMKSGTMAGERKVTYFTRGLVIEVPDLMADNMIALGYAVEGSVADDALPTEPGQSSQPTDEVEG